MPASIRCSRTLDASFCESGTTLVTKSPRAIARAWSATSWSSRSTARRRCSLSDSGAALEEPPAHALRNGDGFHPRELKGHEERFVLRRDLLTEDRELHSDGSELR